MADHVCPVWIGYVLASPVRKLFQAPGKLLGPHVAEGMTVVDIGCAMGFFSIPLARMVGQTGRVVCVDVEARMLAVLRRRAAKAGVEHRVEAHLCGPTSLGIDLPQASIDFALAFAMRRSVSLAPSSAPAQPICPCSAV